MGKKVVFHPGEQRKIIGIGIFTPAKLDHAADLFDGRSGFCRSGFAPGSCGFVVQVYNSLPDTVTRLFGNLVSCVIIHDTGNRCNRNAGMRGNVTNRAHRRILSERNLFRKREEKYYNQRNKHSITEQKKLVNLRYINYNILN